MDTASSMKNMDDLSFDLRIPGFFENQKLRIRLSTGINTSHSYIILYKGKQLLQKIPEAMAFYSGDLPEPVRVADINGDGLMDIKISVSYHGCGLAAEYVKVIYLFQQPGNKFTKIAYTDMMYDNRPERDMDGDGKYEIITKTIQEHKTHNYWLFNIYSFKDNALVNVNDKYGFPIMVQYLYRQNYTPANISNAILKKYAVKLPEEYEVNKAK